jgi:hypothetical protein
MHLPRHPRRILRKDLDSPAAARTALLAALATFLLGAGASAEVPPPEPGKPVFEEWVLVVLDGKTCGYGMTQVTAVDTPSGPGYLTLNHQEFLVKRLGFSLKMIETSKVVEDKQGGVLSFENRTEAGGSDIKSSGVRQGDEMLVSSHGQTQRFNLPRLAALGPEAVRRETLQVPLQAGQTFSFDTFDPDYPQADVVQSGTVAKRETIDVRGVKRTVWRLTSTASFMPGVEATTWVDDQGNDVLMDASLPGFGTMHEYVTDRAECMKQPEGAEIFSGSLIRPQRALTPIADLGQAVYHLESVDKNNLKLWDGDQQRVLSSGPGTCDVEVTVPRLTAADATWQLPHADTPALHTYLQSSSYLEVSAPIIHTLARQAVGNEKNPVVAAHKIEQFVRAYITRKDLNVGFGSAEETAKSREGDCTEHAVLCAALGRAVGLPTRCVVGFGYIPPGEEIPTITNTVDHSTGIFGFHMWAEAWIADGQWVPMDAALDGFDVGHIAITKSALEEVNPIVDLNMPILQLMESLKITVIKTVPKSQMPAAPAPAVAATPAPVRPTPPPAPVTPVPAPVSTPKPAPAPPPPPQAPPSQPTPSLPPLD